MALRAVTAGRARDDSNRVVWAPLTAGRRNRSRSSLSALGGGPEFARGQGFLRERLTVATERDLRRRTALRDWIAATAGVLSQQLTPLGIKLSVGWFVAMSVFSLTAISISAFVYPRVRGRSFVVAEQIMMMIAWGATSALVYASGGAGSPYIFFFAQSMIYSAYFFARSGLSLTHVGIGSLAAALPVVYDTQAAVHSGFLPTIALSLAIWWTICVLIAVTRGETLAAEREARRIALTDPLTGVSNLRASEEFAAELEAAGAGFGVAMVDLDGLKAANTDFGHAGGDDLIRRLAGALCAACGPNDQVARTGGDEFVVLLPQASRHSIGNWAATLTTTIAADNANAGRGRPQLSASVGIALAPGDATTLSDLMSVADARMFAQKFVPAVKHSGETVRGGRALTAAAPEPEQSRLRRLAWAEAPAGPLVATIAALATAAAVYLTGSAESELVSVVMVVVAYLSHFGTRRQAVSGVATALTLFAAAYFGGGTVATAGQTRFSTIVFGSLVIAWALQVNGRKMTEARERADEAATRDPLTGVSNRRAFELDFADALEHFNAPRETHDGAARAALVLIDVDHFKQVNTLLGHQGGDKLLRAIADRLRDAVADDGRVYRIGGDEFAVICGPACAWPEALAGRCRTLVASIGAEAWCARDGVPVSISTGVAHARSGISVPELMRQADGEMMSLKAKRDGTGFPTGLRGAPVQL